MKLSYKLFFQAIESRVCFSLAISLRTSSSLRSSIAFRSRIVDSPFMAESRYIFISSMNQFLPS